MFIDRFFLIRVSFESIWAYLVMIEYVEMNYSEVVAFCDGDLRSILGLFVSLLSLCYTATRIILQYRAWFLTARLYYRYLK